MEMERLLREAMHRPGLVGPGTRFAPPRRKPLSRPVPFRSPRPPRFSARFVGKFPAALQTLSLLQPSWNPFDGEYAPSIANMTLDHVASEIDLVTSVIHEQTPNSCRSSSIAMDSTRVFYGGPGVEHPGVSLAEYTLRHLSRLAEECDQPAQVDAVTGQSDSFAWLLETSVRAAEGWRAAGLGSADTVAVCCNNRRAIFPIVLGAVYNGCTVAAIVPSSNAEELRESLRLVRPRALLSDEDSVAPACAALEDMAGVLHVEVVEQGAPALGLGTLTTECLLRLAVTLPDPSAYRPAHIADLRQHAAYILFSSGSTGKPKAVLISNYSFLIHSLNPGSWAVLPGEKFLVTSPLSWISGALMLLQCTFVGATRVFLKTCGDEHTWLRTIDQYKISLTFAPPWLLSLVPGALQTSNPGPSGYNLSSLRAVCTGGAALGADMQARLQDALGPGGLVAQGYGCTEAGVAFSDSTGLPGQPPPRHGSLGRLLPWVHLRLVDVATGRDISEDCGEGELRYKTPYIMLGYLGDPVASATGFDQHGYYCTGDLVRRDRDGYYYFVERIKELMKFNSLPVAASELEEILLTHPLVREVCVVGLPHVVHGDLPSAFVVRVPEYDYNDQQLQEELHQLVKARLSDHKLLRGGIYFLELLPKTPSGKMDRRRLKEKLRCLSAPIDSNGDSSCIKDICVS